MQTSNSLTRAYRALRVVLHIIIGILILATYWRIASESHKLILSKWWSKTLVRCFNFRVVTFGQPPTMNTTSTMFVANHISWADIYAINSIIPLRFIAKSELSEWPIFGYLVRHSGTLFIDRSRRKDAARIVEIAKHSLIEGNNIGFFPEGTTTDGTHIVKFKSSILQAAIDARAQVWPIAIKYPLPNGDVNTSVAYAGETTMAESMLSVLKQQNPVVELHFLNPLSNNYSTRQTLSDSAYSSISNVLNTGINA